MKLPELYRTSGNGSMPRPTILGWAALAVAAYAAMRLYHGKSFLGLKTTAQDNQSNALPKD